MTIHTLGLISLILIVVEFFTAFGATLAGSRETPKIISIGIGFPAMIFVFWLLLTIVL